MAGGVKLKRVKYTNTGITPLSVIRSSDKGHYIFDDSKNGILGIYVIRVRNHSKNESAKCKVKFDGKTFVLNGSKESILCEISNVYLAYMLLFANRRELYDKFFTKFPFNNRLLDGYIWKCVLIKLRKDGILKWKLVWMIV